MYKYWVFFGLLGMIGEIFTIYWHKRREEGGALSTAVLSGVLEALTWAPVGFVIVSNDLGVIFTSILGSSVGTYIGMKTA